jgi:hypothetical protein
VSTYEPRSPSLVAISTVRIPDTWHSPREVSTPRSEYITRAKSYSPSSTVFLPPTSVIPINGVVIPETYAPASVCVLVLSSGKVIIPEEFVPSIVPTRDIQTISTPPAISTNFPIPETFHSPVVVDTTLIPHWVQSSSILTIPGSPGVVVVPVSVVPKWVSTNVIIYISTPNFVPVPP